MLLSGKNTLTGNSQMVAIRDIKTVSRGIFQHWTLKYGLNLKKRDGFVAVNINRSRETMPLGSGGVNFVSLRELDKSMREAQKRYDETKKLNIFGTLEGMKKTRKEVLGIIQKNKFTEAFLNYRAERDIPENQKINLDDFKAWSKEKDLQLNEEDFLKYIVLI